MIQVKVEDGGAVEIPAGAEVVITGQNGRRFCLRIFGVGWARIFDGDGKLTHEASSKVVDGESPEGV